MKRGFTLVELLAVIVILAVIALITIPAVMRMIDSSTMNSYRRSVDLYGKAISQAVVSYQSDMIEKGHSIDVTFNNIEQYIEYEGNDVDCKIKQIYSDKTILLTECSVDEELVVAEKNKGYSNENYYYYTNSKKKMKTYEYIKAVEEELKDKNITGTCTIIEDKLTCNGQDFTIKSNLENAIEGTLVIENSKVKSYKGLKFATEKKNETNNEVPQVIDEENTSNENGENNNNQTLQESIATDDDYRGYYAGIIYADLGANIQYPQSGDFYNDKTNWNKGDGTYSYNKATGNLNEYTISNNTYKKNDGFGENKIIKLKKDNNNPRFYVMALEDFATTDDTTFYWYKNAYGKMNASDTSTDFGKGYANTGKIIEIWEKNGIGDGSYQGATQDNQDIFKHIQEKYNSKEKWYIPSRGEWAAFADYLKKKTTNPLTHNYESGSYVENSGNYKSLYGLSDFYWLSSQRNSYYAWIANFNLGYMRHLYVDYYGLCVRLGATF